MGQKFRAAAFLTIPGVALAQDNVTNDVAAADTSVADDTLANDIALANTAEPERDDMAFRWGLLGLLGRAGLLGLKRKDDDVHGCTRRQQELNHSPERGPRQQCRGVSLCPIIRCATVFCEQALRSVTPDRATPRNNRRR